MARKPNYRFDRIEKDRVKAAKKAERLKAKQEKSAKGRQPSDSADPESEVELDSEAEAETEPNTEPHTD